MSSFVGAVAIELGWRGASWFVERTAGNIGGYYGYTLLTSTVKNSQAVASRVLGSTLGHLVGGVAGKIIAGGALPEAAAQAAVVSGAINTIGQVGVGLLKDRISAMPKAAPEAPPVVPNAVVANQGIEEAVVAAPAEEQAAAGVVVEEEVLGAIGAEPVAPPIAQEAPAVAPPIVQAAAAAAPAIPVTAAEIAAAAAAAAVAAVNAAEKKEKPAPAPDKKAEWVTTAINVAQAGAVLGGALLLVGTGSGIAIPLAYGAMTNLPSIINAATEDAKDGHDADFYEDVMKPVAKNFAFAGLGTAAQNIASFNVVQNAYNIHVLKGKKFGSWIGSFMPNPLGGIFSTTCELAAKAEAGRVAMSPKTLEHAQRVGLATKQIVETGLELGHTIVQKHVEQENTGWWGTAEKAAWITAGGLGAGCLVLGAPVVASVPGIGLLALGSVAPTIRWFRTKKPAETEAPKPEESIVAAPEEEKPTVTIQVEGKPAAPSLGLDLEALLTELKAQEPSLFAPQQANTAPLVPAAG